jgi:hypothetical protein
MSIRDCLLPHVLMPSSAHSSIGAASRVQRKLSNLNVQCVGRSTSALLIASLMLGVSSSAVLAGDDSRSSKADQATNKALLKKLDAMERRMQALEAELNQKRRPKQAASTARTAASLASGRPPVGGPPPGPYAQAAATDPASGTKNNDLFGVGTSPVPGLKIGMYGEIKFGTQQNPNAGGQWQNGFDMARVVLLPTYQVTDNIIFNAEIEFEHSGIAFDNDGKRHGAAEIEQAFFDIRFNDYFTLRSPGVDIIPISFNNLYHEPTLFYSVQRPELANGLIPTTWVAPSAGFYGKIVDGLNYQFQVSQSLEDFGDDFDHRGENGAVVPFPTGYEAGISGTEALGLARAPLGDFSQLSNKAAFTGRLSYQPGFLPGFAGSTAVYYSPDVTPRGAYADDGTALGKNSLTIVDTEARYRVPNTGLELRAEYAHVSFGNPENLRANNDGDPENNAGKNMYGYSGEIAYHFRLGTILGSDWEAVPFYRYTRQNLQTGGLFGIDPNGMTGSGDQTFHDVGLAVFPNPSLVFKVNYTKMLDHSATGPMSDRVLGGVGWLW